MKPSRSEVVEPELTDDEKEAVHLASVAFNDLRRSRHELGKTEYGEYTFLQNDTIRMMLEELADLMNYAEMSAVRIILAQTALEESLPAEAELGFKGTKEGWGNDG